MAISQNPLEKLIVDIEHIHQFMMKLSINPESANPIYIQLYNGLVSAMALGEISPGDKLPSTRTLAKDLHINFITVNKAYNLLESHGYVKTIKKRVVAIEPTDRSRQELIRKWKDSESQMITEARASKIPDGEIRAFVQELLKTLQ